MKDSSPPSAPEIAHQWWHGLSKERSGYARAALARIRRAGSALEVMQEPAALRLVSRLMARDVDPDRVAALAGVLAHVSEHDESPLARAVGRKTLDDDGALLSEGRFRRLLQTESADLLDPMRRLVRMTKGKANVRDLGVAVLFWGDRVKKDWIFHYYGIAPVTRLAGEESQEQPTKEADSG